MKDEIKIEVENENIYQKEQLVNRIIKNPDLLEELSLERLVKLRDYYKVRIQKKEQLLKNMKKYR